MRVPIYKRLIEARDNPNADLHKLTTDILALFSVSGMFSEEQMGQAFCDGVEAEKQQFGDFDIENYR